VEISFYLHQVIITAEPLALHEEHRGAISLFEHVKLDGCVGLCEPFSASFARADQIIAQQVFVKDCEGQVEARIGYWNLKSFVPDWLLTSTFVLLCLVLESAHIVFLLLFKHNEWVHLSDNLCINKDVCFLNSHPQLS